jgi:hypothetical protein
VEYRTDFIIAKPGSNEQNCTRSPWASIYHGLSRTATETAPGRPGSPRSITHRNRNCARSPWESSVYHTPQQKLRQVVLGVLPWRICQFLLLRLIRPTARRLRVGPYLVQRSLDFNLHHVTVELSLQTVVLEVRQILDGVSIGRVLEESLPESTRGQSRCRRTAWRCGRQYGTCHR